MSTPRIAGDDPQDAILEELDWIDSSAGTERSVRSPITVNRRDQRSFDVPVFDLLTPCPDRFKRNRWRGDPVTKGGRAQFSRLYPFGIPAIIEPLT